MSRTESPRKLHVCPKTILPRKIMRGLNIRRCVTDEKRGWTAGHHNGCSIAPLALDLTGLPAPNSRHLEECIRR